MKISYKSKKEEKFFSNKKSLTRAYGLRMADKIVQRISELQAATNSQNLPPACRFHEHQGARKGLFSLDLVNPQRLIVRPMNKYSSYIEITEVEIFEVIDPH